MGQVATNKEKISFCVPFTHPALYYIYIYKHIDINSLCVIRLRFTPPQKSHRYTKKRARKPRTMYKVSRWCRAPWTTVCEKRAEEACRRVPKSSNIWPFCFFLGGGMMVVWKGDVDMNTGTARLTRQSDSSHCVQRDVHSTGTMVGGSLTVLSSKPLCDSASS